MLLDIFKNLIYHQLEVSVSPVKEVEIEGWLGAVIRNHLLFAAEQVRTSDDISLLSVINRFPLTEGHPLYKSLSGGFPKGFALAVLAPSDCYYSRCILRPGQTIVFSLVLIGRLSAYYENFIEALRIMCRLGLGLPSVPLRLEEVCERDFAGRRHRIAIGSSDKTVPLRYPVCPENFEEEKFGQKETIVRFRFKSPVLLATPGEKTNKAISFQDKLNGFPSFYQFIRSAVYRCAKLAVLYSCPEDTADCGLTKEDLEQYINPATSAMLLQANIRRLSMCGPKRNDGQGRILFSGYVGELVFSGDFTEYMALLFFMQSLGIGNDTVYGLGNYRIEVLRTTEPVD